MNKIIIAILADLILSLFLILFWALGRWWRPFSTYKEKMIIKDFKKTPVGRSTKRQVALLHANKLRNNKNILCVDRRSSLKRNHIY